MAAPSCDLMCRIAAIIPGVACTAGGIRSGRDESGTRDHRDLRHQLGKCHASSKCSRSAMIADGDRALAYGAVASSALPRPQRAGWLVTPETAVALAPTPNLPPLDPTLPGAGQTIRLRPHFVVSSSKWPTTTPPGGYRRITGELAGASVTALEPSTAVENPQTPPHRLPPRQRTSVTWTQFLRSQAAVACDFATVDTVLLRRCYLLFFIDIANREVLLRRASPPTRRETLGPPKPPATFSCSHQQSRFTRGGEHFCETAPRPVRQRLRRDLSVCRRPQDS